MFEYYILNPTGNITAIVIDKGISASDYPEISNAIMKKHNTVEQVGFLKIEGSHPILHMAGGEFCGNATMCAAVLFCKINCLSDTDTFVEVYGIKDLISVQICKTGDGYDCKAKLPKPESISDVNFEIDGKSYSLPTVKSAGITHIISCKTIDNLTAERIIRKYSKIFDVPALGIMLLDTSTLNMTPIVYVQKCDTLFYENSCASGSCAVCAYLTQGINTEKEFVLAQPAGSLTVSSSDLTDHINLMGNVKIQNHYFKEI